MEPVQRASRSNYAAIALQGKSLQELFRKYKIPMGPSLSRICDSANFLSTKWEEKKKSELTPPLLWDALSLIRISEPLLALDENPRASELLKKLADGEIGMLKHERTLARDIFWEVEIWNYLKRAGLSADLNDPPDVIWNAAGQRTGIACKRIYSEKHIQNVLSQAVRQIESTTGFGVAAFQLEDSRTPEGSILETESLAKASTILQNANLAFLKEHERHFLKYFSKDRLTAALVATSAIVVADIPHIGTEWCIWTHPGLSADHKARVKQLYPAPLRRGN